jgi:5'-methylthioadenosine phosphorylase
MFGNPFSDKLNAFVAPRVEEILKNAEGSPKLHTGKTVVCMEGESYAVRRVSRSMNRRLTIRTRFLYQGRVSDVQAMGWRHYQHVCYPRGQTRPRGRARVRPIPPILHHRLSQLTYSYTLICTSTDYDAWRTGHAPVTVEEVVKTLHTNAGNARAIAAGLMQDVYDVVKEDKLLDEIKGSMRFACITRKEVSPHLIHSAGGVVLMDRFNPRLLGRSCLSSCLTSPTRLCSHGRGGEYR